MGNILGGGWKGTNKEETPEERLRGWFTCTDRASLVLCCEFLPMLKVVRVEPVTQSTFHVLMVTEFDNFCWLCISWV